MMLRKYVVFLYLFACLAQVCLTFQQGHRFISFERSSQAAEDALQENPLTQFHLEQAEAQLEVSASALLGAKKGDSRWARLTLDRAILDWSRGEVDRGEAHFKKAIEEYEFSHGPDSFHSNAVRLRYAELLFGQRRYSEGLKEVRAGLPRVADYLGNRDLFVVRMGLHQARVLVYTGEKSKGAAIFKRLVPLLLKDVDSYDQGIHASVGQTLDFLVHDSLYPPPSEGGSWKDVIRLRKSSTKT